MLAWEKAHHGDPTKSRPEWQGHCHLAAPASVMFVNPPAEGLEYNGVEFLAEELKFYAAEFVGRFGRFTPVYELPTDGSGARKGELHEMKPSQKQELFGTDPHALLGLLGVVRRELGVSGNALVVDFRDMSGLDHAEVWNQAVYRYVTRYWQPDVSDPTLTDGSCALFSNADRYTGTVTSGLPAHTELEHGETVVKHDVEHEVCRNEFTVRFTASGTHDASAPENRWKATLRRGVDTFAPRYALRIERPAKKVVEAHGNPRIDPKHVLELLRLRPEFR